MHTLLRKLIATPSQTGSEENIAEVLYEHIASLGLTPIKQDGNIVALIPGEIATRALILSGHIDTVSEGDPANWLTSPFEPKQDDKRIYGLGSSDMKSGITGYFDVLGMLGDKPPVDIWLAFVTGEELDGSGSKSFVEWFSANHKQNYEAVECIIAEPTDAQFVGVGHRGNMFLSVRIPGTAAHASLEINENEQSIFKAENCIAALKKLEESWKKKFSDTVLGAPTLAITGMQAGSQATTNKLPEFTELTLDVRTIPEIHNQVVSDIQKTLDQYKDVNVTVIESCPAGWTDESSILRQIASRELPNLEHLPTAGAADLCFFVEAGIPTILYGPGHRDVMHATNEYVEISSMEICTKNTKQLIEAFGAFHE